MSAPGTSAALRFTPRPCTLVVCRGCCCGNPRKHPGTDHAWQLERLRAAAADSGGRFTVRTTDCLGPCDQANVIVVQPSSAGRRAGGRAVWVGFATDDAATEELLEWAAAGGPGVAAPPVTLELQFIPAPREGKVRRAGSARREGRVRRR
ncbi:(2Fe-2S) ferredoxin domain-containing protein [Streptomyces glaucescens]|uniref:(2Fe-2S) ferredoxin domain-containing protein n=1 Tax=Streptomyces glaucescens TaxID=1907 RepID=UPI00344CEAB8